MPPIAGAISWTSGLYERVREPMDRLQLLSQSIQDREEYKDIQKLYNSLCKSLREFEQEKIESWEKNVAPINCTLKSPAQSTPNYLRVRVFFLNCV